MKKMNKTDKSKTKNYYVEGMHCSSCELLIKQDIIEITGVNKVDVSLSRSQVTIDADDIKNIPTSVDLTRLFKERGYTFHDRRPNEQNLYTDDVLKTMAIAILFVIVFYVFERSGLFMKFSLTDKSSLTAYFIFGLVAGLSSCAALVGGILLSLSKTWSAIYGNNVKRSVTPFIYFNVSRVITFTLLGGLLGYLGSLIQLSPVLTAVLTLCIALLMMVVGLQMAGIRWFNKFSFNFLGNNKYLTKNSEIKGKYVPLIVGALTFFIPCGFTLIAQTNTLNAGSFYMGALQLGIFALGTLPILALISFSSIKLYSNPKFSKRFSLFSGVLITFFAFYTINSQLNVLGFISLNDISFPKTLKKNINNVVTNNNNHQLIQLEAKNFEYYPTEVTIRSGIKTQLSIYDSGSVGCARAVYARGLYPDVIYLNPGKNTVEFIAPQPGTYKISCSMGMVPPVTVKVL